MLGDGKGLRGERHREAGDSGRCGEVRRSLHLLRGSPRGQGRAAGRGHPGGHAATSFTPDGRCVTLLKVLMTNVCVYDCCYCVNRASNAEAPEPHSRPASWPTSPSASTVATTSRGCSSPRASPACPDRTTELMIAALRILREEYGFRGYIHAKAIPGTSVELIDELGRLSDRLSREPGAAERGRAWGFWPPTSRDASILAPMRHICDSIADDAESALAGEEAHHGVPRPRRTPGRHGPSRRRASPPR